MKLSLRRAAAVTAGTAALTILAGCGTPAAPEPTVSTLRMNVLGVVLSGNWNPVTSTYLNTYFQPAQAVYESFVQLDPSTYEWKPQLAESYEIGDDQRSMTIRLREDVDFTDGTHLDAEAAKRSFEYALSGTQAGFAAAFEPTMAVTGEYELLLTTSKSMGTDFFWLFAIIPIASPTAIEDDPEGLEETPVGTGPYLFEDEVVDVSATFVRNPDYRNPEAFPFDEVEFLVFDDPVAVSNALKSGQLDAGLIDPAYAADLEGAGFRLNLGTAAHIVMVWNDPNGLVSPELADVRVRQAIALSLDRQGIVDTLEFGYGTVTSQVWGAGSPEYVEGGDDTYAYDLERAKQLMAEAAYEDGFDLTMPTMPSNGKYEPVITQSLADIGITVVFDSYADPIEFFTAADSGKYALHFRGQSDIFLSANARTGPQEIRELYQTVDTGTRQEAEEALQEIGQLVLDDALLIAVSRPAEIWATIPEITVESSVVSWPVRLSDFRPAD